MIVLHNSDHSMSISDIDMCVSESPWARCGCSGAPVHLHWWGWVQPHKKTKEGKEYHRPACHCWSPWPARREHHNVYSDYPPRRHPSPCYPWPLQHRPSDHPTHTLIPPDQVDGPEQLRYVVIWDNVSFHRAALVRNWFTAHPCFLVVYLPPYSPFLNPIEEFFSAWRWKVYDWNPQMRIPLLQAMEDACEDIAADAFHGWNQIKSNHFYCHITTAQVPWWVKFLRACSRHCKKTTIYIWTVHIYRLYRRQCAKNTYIYSVHIVYYKDILNYQLHIIHRMCTSTLCTLSIHYVVYT